LNDCKRGLEFFKIVENVNPLSAGVFLKICISFIKIYQNLKQR